MEVTIQVCTLFIVTGNRGQSDRSYPGIGTFQDGIIKSQGNMQGYSSYIKVSVAQGFLDFLL